MRVTAFLTLALALVAPAAWADPSAAAGPVETAWESPDAIAGHPEVTAWVSGGIGPALIGGDTGSSKKALGVTVGVGRNLLSLRYRYTEEIQDCGQPACGLAVAPLNSNTELAFEYGVRARFSVFLATASVGLSALWITERGNTLLSSPGEGNYGTDQHNAISHFTVGATWELGAYLTSRFISVGPTFVLTADAFQSTAAILFDLHFGYMGERDR